MTQHHSELAAVQHVTEWEPDDAPWHNYDSIYVETFWLPVIGPSSWCLLRMLARGAQARGGLHVRFTDAARAVGLSPALDPNSAMVRTVTRLDRFQLLRQVGTVEWEVRQRVPNVPPKSLGQLLPVQRRLHSMWLEQPA